MKTHQKLISGLLSVALIAGLGISNAAAAPAKEFKDVPTNHWAHGDIQTLTQMDVLVGYSNGKFGPQDSVTRAQAAKIISLASDIKPIKTSKATYKDVPANHWASSYIEALTKAGVVDGKGNGNFGPQELLTRAQMSKLLGESFGYTASSNTAFKDVKSDHWAFKYITALRDNKISVGYPEDNTYRPNSNVTRAQMAAFANRSIKWEKAQVTVPTPTPKPETTPKPTVPKPTVPTVPSVPKPTPKPPVDYNDPDRPIDDSISEDLNNSIPKYPVPEAAKTDKYPESFTMMHERFAKGFTDVYFLTSELSPYDADELIKRVIATDKNKFKVSSWTVYSGGLVEVKYSK